MNSKIIPAGGVFRYSSNCSLLGATFGITESMHMPDSCVFVVLRKLNKSTAGTRLDVPVGALSRTNTITSHLLNNYVSYAKYYSNKLKMTGEKNILIEGRN